jgi:hypothetical protein
VNVVRYEAHGGPARHALIERWDYRETTGLFELERTHDLELTA